MSRPRHPNKHIEAAIQHAESLGWRVQLSSGHAWGKLFCPHRARGSCIISVWSTPRSPENHARQIRRAVDRCPHDQEAPTNDEEGPANDEEGTGTQEDE
jgi:hypothetical protein